MYGLFVLPESLKREQRTPLSWRKANPVGALKLLRSHHELWGLTCVAFLSNLAHAALPSVAVLYMSYRYNWDINRVGVLLAGVGVCSIIVQGFLVGRVVKAIGERQTILFGLVAGALGFTIQAMAPNGAVYAVGVVVMSLWGLMGPALQGWMTRLVSPSEQGQLQGANSSLLGISALIGPMLFTYTFSAFIAEHRDWHLPGAPFLLSAILLVGSLTVALRVMATRLQSVPAANP
jgi:DHA1 family tetracycline resistance protein-like MFS transporter